MITANQREWLKGIYLDAVEDHIIAASNEHLWALGSDDMKMSAMHEQNAEEHRNFVQMLRDFADNI